LALKLYNPCLINTKTIISKKKFRQLVLVLRLSALQKKFRCQYMLCVLLLGILYFLIKKKKKYFYRVSIFI